MRKIIHIDMDCFYAAIEERENPALRGRPLAVGGSRRRGVLTTANYEARKYGCRSAMPVFKALELCPHLVLVPVRFDLYRSESARIRAIFGRFTDQIEPLSLDEAYLDISHCRTSGAAIAREIRSQIKEETGLTASAGISTNKMVAKIASDWNKPDGQFEVTHDQIDSFVAALPVGRLWGVGKRSREQLASLGVETCEDLRKFDKIDLAKRFGKWGLELWELCRGIDPRPVTPNRTRKSLGSEETFPDNILTANAAIPAMRSLIEGLKEELLLHHADRTIRGLVVKLKFADFSRTTAERAHQGIDEALYEELLHEAWKRGEGKPVRLIGVALRFEEPEAVRQMDFFGETMTS